MQFIILGIFFGFVVLAIKGIVSFIFEYSVFFGVVIVFIVSYTLLILLNSHVEKWKASKTSKEKELNSVKTGKEQKLSNADIISKAGYPYKSNDNNAVPDTSLSEPVFTEITVGGNTDDFNQQNEAYWNFEGETAVDDNIFTTSELSSLKKKAPETAVPLRRPYIVFSDIGESLYSDMKKFEKKTEKRASFSDFEEYYPTYDDMLENQKKWYFYWRNKVRNKSYPKTDLSYIFLYVYELLCDIGVQNDTDGLNKLMAVWSSYRKEFPKLDNYLPQWVFDYCCLHNLPYGPLPFDDISVSNDEALNKLIDRHDHEHPLKLPLYLIIGLSDYKITKSKLYKSHEQLMKNAVPKVIALADMYFWQKEGKGLFEKFGPATESKYTRKIYPSTLFTNMKQEYICKDYKRTKELRDIITGVIKFSENVLRSIEGVSGRIKSPEAFLRYTELQSIIEKYLYSTYGKKQYEANPGTAVPTNFFHEPAPVESSSELDFDKIEKLRKESDNVRKILEVQEEEEEKVLLTDIAGMQLVLANISEQSKNLIYSLRSKGWVDRYDSSMKLLVDEANRIALKYLSQDLLIVDSDSNISVEEDFRDEIDYIWQSNNADTATAADVTNQVKTGNNSNDREPARGTTFNYSGLPEELTDCLKSFTSTQEAALVAVLKEERPYEAITALADEAMTMPEVIIDEINEISDSYLNELLIEQDEENLSVIEPYQGMLKKALEMEV